MFCRYCGKEMAENVTRTVRPFLWEEALATVAKEGRGLTPFGGHAARWPDRPAPERKSLAASAPIGLYCACPGGQNGNLG